LVGEETVVALAGLEYEDAGFTVVDNLMNQPALRAVGYYGITIVVSYPDQDSSSMVCNNISLLLNSSGIASSSASLIQTRLPSYSKENAKLMSLKNTTVSGENILSPEHDLKTLTVDQTNKARLSLTRIPGGSQIILSYQVWDSSNNVAVSAKRTINVLDNHPVSLDLEGPNYVELNFSISGDSSIYNDPGVVATKFNRGDQTSSVCSFLNMTIAPGNSTASSSASILYGSPLNISTSTELGRVYRITYWVTDMSGYMATTSRVLVVKDLTPPGLHVE
jgi:hypothetical protein